MPADDRWDLTRRLKCLVHRTTQTQDNTIKYTEQHKTQNNTIKYTEQHS